jgi:hypothetical protein
MLQIDSTGSGPDRVSKLVTPKEAAEAPLFAGGVARSVLLDALEGFVAGGLDAGEGVLVLATAPHLRELRRRLGRRLTEGSPATRASWLPLDAGATVGRFLVAGWPDAARFDAWLRPLVARLGEDGRRRVRAFDEMVAFLGRRGEYAAMLRLEQLWHDFCHGDDRFSLLLASARVGAARGTGAMRSEARPEQYLG